MVGDAAETLRALHPLLQRKEDRSWREEIEPGVERWWRLLDERAHVDADPVNPQLVFHELSRAAARWRDRPRRLGLGHELVRAPPAPAPRHGHGPVGHAGHDVPGGALRAGGQARLPERPVVACLGDGAMQMLGINALIDVARYRDRWSDPLVVLRAQQRRSQPGDLGAAGAGRRREDADLAGPAAFDFAAYARQLGLKGIRVETPGEVGPAWDAALAADRPVVLDVVTDPEVPPLPPHIRLEHAQGFARALLHGDPASARIVRQSLREKLKDLVTR